LILSREGKGRVIGLRLGSVQRGAGLPHEMKWVRPGEPDGELNCQRGPRQEKTRSSNAPFRPAG
ncbi:hypothetical protein, partial [Methylopila sp. 73B]|uniref:hypothetical protein n=1 Tax=Methylopila sp. 73B TaxID=1120792 RepID=UPI001AEC6274